MASEARISKGARSSSAAGKEQVQFLFWEGIGIHPLE
jgi:hypothetical protein